MSLFQKKYKASSATHSKEDVIRRAKDSVVCIRTDEALGAGFFIDFNGVLATNKHVVEGQDEVEIIFSDESSTTGRVLYRDPTADIAFVIAGMKAKAPLQAEVGRALEPGIDVFAIDHPLGLEY